eukprot:TRINITY_DN3116_c1_g2_i1.p2 TRINITY_DN3116_c1_g2~~TRINITY_DN3116_c1_g2_i1.p2  ORF type:complete len:148 (+),score=18.70 TRINITY_DN3116_c1_g2_i1:67-510(+)
MQTSALTFSSHFFPTRPQRLQHQTQQQRKLNRVTVRVSATPKNNSPQNKNTNKPDDIINKEDIDYLLPEEDYTVPGGYEDSLSSNTPLGQAVRGACDELDTLGSIEKDVLKESSDLLKKLGYKGDIFKPKNPENQTELEKQLAEEET